MLSKGTGAVVHSGFGDGYNLTVHGVENILIAKYGRFGARRPRAATVVMSPKEFEGYLVGTRRQPREDAKKTLAIFEGHTMRFQTSPFNYHIAAHEALHAMAHVTRYRPITFGDPGLDEGLTEILARVAFDTDDTLGGYRKLMPIMHALLQVCGLELLARTYFEWNLAPLRQTLRERLGVSGEPLDDVRHALAYLIVGMEERSPTITRLLGIAGR